MRIVRLVGRLFDGLFDVFDPVVGIVMLIVVVNLTGCGTVSQRVNESPAPSWVGDKQDSGVEVVAGSGRFAPITRDAYNRLIEVYGQRFFPPLTFDEGITPGAPNGWYYANHFARVHFFVMTTWARSAMHPAPTLLQKAGITK